MKVRVAVLAVLAAVAGFAQPVASNAANSVGPLGIVRHHGSTVKVADTLAQRRRSNLRYHGGRIVQHNTTHAIFWRDPSATAFPAGYEDTVQQYFDDVAAASGTTDNVYAITRQYYEVVGGTRRYVDYDITSGAKYDDAHPYPTRSSSCPTSSRFSFCVTDGQIRQELEALHLSAGFGDIYFVFLPPGVNSCAGRIGCFSTSFCAYHSATSDSPPILYTNQPFADVPGCRSGEHPNANSADDTINVVSHEHIETMTDPLGNAWFGGRGGEIADKCAWRFGFGSGDSNQTINGDGYYLQKEWSNRRAQCRLHPAR